MHFKSFRRWILVPSFRGVTNCIYIVIYYFSAIHVHFKLQKPALPSLTYDIRCMCSLPISFDTFKGMINKETSKSSVLSYVFYFLCLGYCLHGMQAIIWYFYFVYLLIHFFNMTCFHRCIPFVELGPAPHIPTGSLPWIWRRSWPPLRAAAVLPV